jgi:hypothetical protein
MNYVYLTRYQRAEGKTKRVAKRRIKRPKNSPPKNTFMNSVESASIDSLIKTLFWPAVLRGLEDTDFFIDEGAIDQIENARSVYPSRAVTFVVQDHDRPVASENRPPWYCRGNLRCSLSDYMLSFDFFIQLPITFNVWRIIELIGNPLFAGNPPHLSVEHDLEGGKHFIVSFSSGRGAGFGLENSEQAAATIERRIRANIRVIGCVDDLYLDLESAEALGDLQNALLAEYESS